MSDAENKRDPIVKGIGLTPSERQLAQLADRSFLDLWSYPNPYRDQRAQGGNGKELCDLLVVCGDHILIFSEKTYTWPDAPLEIAWQRWFRKAIKKSLDQIRGAERWIRDYPDRIFLDAACTKPFPLNLPPIERRRVHGIVVANGAGQACKDFFSGGTGSFAINPSIKAADHHAGEKIEPFWIGDIDPEGSFIHVLGDGSLSIIMDELDTVTDLANYFDKKAAFIRSGHLAAAGGEEDLLAYYMVRMNDRDEHDFTHPKGRAWRSGERIAIDQNHYSKLITNPLYLAKKRADKISYVWDKLIRHFTKHMMAGTSIIPEGQDTDINLVELGVREMALRSRYERRILGESFSDAVAASRGREIFLRFIGSDEDSSLSDIGYFALFMSYHQMFEDAGGYERYKEARMAYGRLYADGLFVRYQHLKKIVGVITEPLGPSMGYSDDILYAQRRALSAEAELEIREACRNVGILRDDFAVKPFGGPEFPVMEQHDLQEPLKILKGRDRNQPCACGSGRKWKKCHGS